jgi:hypothetical protein
MGIDALPLIPDFYRSMVLRALIICLAVSATTTLCAQEFTITKVERVGSSVVLTYNLIDTLRNRTYTVALYSSADNYISPLQKVVGDVGLEVRPGANRKITWNAKEELGASFDGNVGLEVRGKVYIPFVKLDGFDDYKKFKRNKDYKITWTGGRGNNVLNFDLYKGTKKITTYPNIANVGHHTIKFEKVKPGKNYTLKISDSKNKDDVVYSAPFKIRAKVSLLVKLIPLAGAGYFISTLLNPDPDNDDIVDPPTPTGN